MKEAKFWEGQEVAKVEVDSNKVALYGICTLHGQHDWQTPYYKPGKVIFVTKSNE